MLVTLLSWLLRSLCVSYGTIQISRMRRKKQGIPGLLEVRMCEKEMGALIGTEIVHERSAALVCQLISQLPFGTIYIHSLP